MKALVDRHQADLFWAMQRLFEDRLGLPVFTPVGPEWWDEGVWQFGIVFGDDRLARQYIHLNAQWQPTVTDGLYSTIDQHHTDRAIYGVTLDLARRQKWTAVVATVQENQPGFARFAAEMGAKYLYQVGNTRQQIDWALDPVCLNSTADVALTGRGALVAQEFDKDRTFRFREPSNRRSVASFVNLLPLIPDPWAAFNDLRVRLPDWRFRSFGHSCPEGLLRPVGMIAEEMADTGWAFMDKVTGDGFGHIIHNWAAIGRPLIGHARYYEGQRAAYFWRDGETCIDLDLHSPDEAAEIMATMPDAQYLAMCRAIRATLDANVDWAADAERVRALL
jgi:hypothetical protein